jgi:aminopeptidase N
MSLLLPRGGVEMCVRILVCALLTRVLLAAPCAFADAPEGIPHELARERAGQISDVRYQLSFVLVPHAGATAGQEEITFNLKSVQTVLLDYRDGAARTIAVNGTTVPVKAENGHLELPAEKLQAGANQVRIEFISQVAPAGKPITQFEDTDDNSEYIYTLFVPMDASMAFPCFDQPDLKGRFQLEVTAPENWTVISNTAVESTDAAPALQRRTRFGETRPISTYLFAFAAGPFRKVHETAGKPGIYARQSKAQRAEAEAPEVQETAARGIEFLSNYFAQPFPFPKYDMVLIPGLAYGGMEHAGATFLREESVVFRTTPTQTDLIGRDVLVLHELTHQWFGDLTTMRWFDDLWLKEGFAQYMAYDALAEFKPKENIWKHFYEAIKPAAYAIDSTQGTTPIYQDIPNLKDAKSAYGAIVYSKAPGVLKQLAFVLGEENFRNGLRVYLKEHAYANAEWSDLVRAFKQVSRQPLDHWAEMWIRHRGMPQVDVEWACESGRVSRLTLSQHDVLGTDDIWPIATQVALEPGDGEPVRIRVSLNAQTMEAREAIGRACPAFVFANDQDYAYGRFLLDASSREKAVEQTGMMHDVFLRTLLWGALWDSVRQAKYDPREFVALAVKRLPGEADESLTQNILAHATTALHRYVSGTARDSLVRDGLVRNLETVAGNEMVQSPEQGMRITWFRGLRGIAETSQGRAKLKAVLNGEIAVPGMELRPLDRWNIVTALLAMGDPDAEHLIAAEGKRDQTGDGKKYAYVANAASPTAGMKKWYFDDYLNDASRPEDWISQSVGAFNYWNQAGLTEPYLRPALEALPQIKRDRKIFFLVGWLDAFIENQQSPEAQAEVHEYLRTAVLDKDLQRKILEAVDELDRTVAIRRKFAN